MAGSITTAFLHLLFISTTLAAPLTTPNQGINTHLLPRALDPSCAPGGNFELEKFALQLPTGSPGKVDQKSGDKLKGCDGWTDKKHFFTGDDGAMVLKVPGSKESSGCVTTPNSKHCRTELRESDPRSWDPKNSKNRLKVRLRVVEADDSKYGTVIGQVKVDDSVSKKPVAELFINKEGELTMGVSQIPDVSSLKMFEVGKAEIGKEFGYEIRYENSKFSVQIDDGEFQELSTGELKAPLSYFKVGNYNQGDSPSEVHILSIDVQHE